MHPLLDIIDGHARERATQVVCRDPLLTLDYRSLRAVAGGLARQIAERAQSARVGILAPTSTATVAAILGAWYAGKTPVPLNFLLAPSELQQVIQAAGVDLIVTIDRFADALAGTGLQTLLLNEQTLRPGQCETPAAEAGDLGAIIYTSGTTAVPKGVELTFDNLVQNARSCIQHIGLNADHVFLGIIPQFHTFGFTALTVVPLVLGATVTYLPRFTPSSVVSTIREQQVSVFIAIASLFGALAASRDTTAEDLASLQYVVSGGEPLSARAAERFEQRFGKRILEGYGMTETSPVVSLNTPEAYRAGSVGRPLPGVTVEAVDDDGNVLAPGEEGELVVGGHGVMRGYRDDAEGTARTIRDGRVHTGDLGRVDADGFIYITGRIKDLIIVGGENVYPREVENTLLEHPAVVEAAVVGMADDVRGEVPVGFVILGEGAEATAEELREFCRGRLAGYKTPRQIRIVPDLPRSPTGKTLKRELRRSLTG